MSWRLLARLDFWPLFLIVQELVVIICTSLVRMFGDGVGGFPLIAIKDVMELDHHAAMNGAQISVAHGACSGLMSGPPH